MALYKLINEGTSDSEIRTTDIRGDAVDFRCMRGMFRKPLSAFETTTTPTSAAKWCSIKAKKKHFLRFGIFRFPEFSGEPVRYFRSGKVGNGHFLVGILIGKCEFSSFGRLFVRLCRPMWKGNYLPARAMGRFCH